MTRGMVTAVADLEILKGGFKKNEESARFSAAKIFASATPTSGHVVVPCTYVASCALKNCNVL